VTEAGWHSTYGARPLKRALQRLVDLQLLEGDVAEGDTARVDSQDGELAFEKAAVAKRAAA
jgi:ATP-dependent Clp protease ATP-binding subunit ClpA